MTNPKPIIYLLYGDDQLVIEDIVRTLRERMGESSTADMNTARFSAKTLDLAEFETVCTTMPFLSDRRLVLLGEAETINKKTPWLERFLGILEACPEQTAVVIHVHVDTNERRSMENFQQRSPIYRWVLDHPDISWSRPCLIPQKKAFDRWIDDRVQSYNGRIEPAAAHALAQITEGDPLLADQEILKLLDFVDYQRAVTADDVEMLTPMHGQGDIFTLVDALGQQDPDTALHELHRLQEVVSLPVIFSMITRQFRLIIQARDCLDRNVDPSSALKGHSFVIQKISAQARNFDMQQLKKIYTSLQEMDLQTKSSSIDAVAALDGFIALYSGAA